MKRQHPTDPNLFWCPKCEKYLPLTREYWYWRNDSKKWRPFCKICHLKSRHKYKSICINCGNKIDATLEQIKRRNIFCSHRCRTKEFISKEALAKMSITGFKKGERRSPGTEFKKGVVPIKHFRKGNIPWNYTMTLITCAYCGKIRKRKPSHLLRGNKATYCGKSCADKARYNGGKEEQKRKFREEIKNLTDRYIKGLMRVRGISPEEINPINIELWRQRLAMKRTLNQFKKWREDYEPDHADVSRE